MTNPQGLINPNQNLISQVTPEQAARPGGYYLGIAFDFLAIALSFTASYFYFDYLVRGASPLGVVIAASAFAAIQAVTFVITSSPGHRRWVILLETIGLFSFFILFPEIEWLYLAALALAVFVFLMWGERGSRGEMENAMKFKFLKVVKPLLAKFASALVLMGVILSLPKIGNDPNFFSSKSFLDISGWTADLTARLYPDFKKDDTVQVIAMKLAETQLADNAQFSTLDAASRERVLQSTAQELIKNFESQSGVTLKSEGTLQSALYQLMSSKLRAWYDAYPRAFIFAWAVLIFFLFRGVGAALSIAVAFFAFLIYEILLAANVIHITGESRLHEIVEYS